MSQPITPTKPFDPLVFWVSASLTVLFVLWSIVFPENMAKTINAVFSWTTTTGLVALQLSSGLKFQYGLELGPSSTYIIIGVLTAIFTFSVYTGLEKGVKLIGDINMWVFVAVWFFILIFGPTIFLINLTTNAIGQYLLHFIPMSLFTAPGYEGNWIGS